MDYLSVGVNFTVAVIGTVVGVYFLYRAFLSRKVLDHLTLSLFIAIGLGAIFGAFSRAWVLPFYFGRAIGRPDIQGIMLDHPWGLIVILIACAWMLMLHLKPLFHMFSFSQWTILTIGATCILTALGTMAAQTIALMFF